MSALEQPPRWRRLQRVVHHYRFMQRPGRSRRQSLRVALWLTQRPRTFHEERQ